MEEFAWIAFVVASGLSSKLPLNAVLYPVQALQAVGQALVAFVDTPSDGKVTVPCPLQYFVDCRIADTVFPAQIYLLELEYEVVVRQVFTLPRKQFGMFMHYHIGSLLLV